MQIEQLLLHLVINMTQIQPKSYSDIEKYVMENYPTPLNEWIIKDAKEAVKVSVCASIIKILI
jgi:hypothetical protein